MGCLRRLTVGDGGIILLLSGDRRRVGHLITNVVASLRVSQDNRVLDGVLPTPGIVAPRHRTRCRVIHATAGRGDELGTVGQRVDDLDVLQLNETNAVLVAVVCRAVPANTDIVGIGVINLLVSVAQLVGGRRPESRGCTQLLLFDGNIRRCRQCGGCTRINRFSVIRAEGGRHIDRGPVGGIIVRVPPVDLQPVGSARSQGLFHVEGEAVQTGSGEGVGGDQTLHVIPRHHARSHPGRQDLPVGCCGSWDIHGDDAAATRHVDR